MQKQKHSFLVVRYLLFNPSGTLWCDTRDNSIKYIFEYILHVNNILADDSRREDAVHCTRLWVGAISTVFLGNYPGMYTIFLEAQILMKTFMKAKICTQKITKMQLLLSSTTERFSAVFLRAYLPCKD